MTNIRKNKKNQINAVAAGVAGAAVGAGVAVAAVAAMNDSTTRKRVQKVVKQAKGQAATYLKNLDSEKNINTGKRTVKRIVASAIKKGTIKKAKTKTVLKPKKAPVAIGRRTVHA